MCVFVGVRECLRVCVCVSECVFVTMYRQFKEVYKNRTILEYNEALTLNS